MKSALKSLAPQWFKEQIKARLAARRAAAFRNSSIGETFQSAAAAVCDSTLEFCAGQRANEISQFLSLIRLTNPKVIGEIGSASGGNLLLFSLVLPSNGKLVSIELRNDPVQKAAYRRLVGPKKELICISGDSHQLSVQEEVRSALAGSFFDVLFIDGDHSFDGVAADFNMYSPFVRPGGVIAFHDVVADVYQRYGRPTPSSTGGVPRFWQLLKSRYPDTWEFIDDPEQDGFGIGAIRWNGELDSSVAAASATNLSGR